MTVRTAFIYGRPGPHPLNRTLAQAVATSFVPIDFLLRWHDVPSSRVRRYLSWLLCALFFPGRRRYHVFFTDGIQFLPLLMRRLGLLNARQRVVGLVANETFFFLRAHRYPKASERAQIWAINRYDALICLGRMQTELARTFVKDGRPLILTNRAAIARQRVSALSQNRPALDGRGVLFVGDGPSQWRGWYKGLDLLVESVALVASEGHSPRLRVLGTWDRDYVESLFARFPESRRRSEFSEERLVGADNVLSSHLADTALYVHLGRGEAFGITVLEAMCAGIPALVSEWTGAREAVEQVDPRLIVPLDPARAAERIGWYFGLSSGERRALSVRSREVASQYTEDRARAVFLEEFRRMLRHFDLPDLDPRSTSP